MPRTLLHVDSSPRSDERSLSRRLTARFARLWREAGPPGERIVRHRDLRAGVPPHVDQAWIAAAYAAPEGRTPDMRRALATSDALVDEFLAADEYLLGAPMYNFGVPSATKAWIDNVVRVGRTFGFDPADADGQYYRPLVPPGRRMTVIVTTGDAGYEPGGPMWRSNQVEPYLRTVFGFVGVSDFRFVYAGNEEFGGERLARSLEAAVGQVEAAAVLGSAVP
jgi:FMN-dependent NADH-azoreductase